jgi:heterodisulfide reductase subunit B2
MKIAYYPGCSAHSTGREYDQSARLVCDRLDVSLREVKDWNCCGASAAHAIEAELAVALGARNLACTAAMGESRVATPCAGCFSRLKAAQHELARPDAPIAREVATRLGGGLPAAVDVLHLLQLVVTEVGLDRVAAEVKQPLKGARVAAYYGCLLTRPTEVVTFDDPEQPRAMDDLLAALGSETVSWSHKAECCGGTFAASQTEIAVELGGEVLLAAREAGAEVVVVACPLCGSNLDTRQQAMEQRLNRKLALPVLYFTQLMGLAFGMRPRALGLKRLLTDPFPTLERWGF